VVRPAVDREATGDGNAGQRGCEFEKEKASGSGGLFSLRGAFR